MKNHVSWHRQKIFIFQSVLTDCEDRQAYGCLGITGDFSAGKRAMWLTAHRHQVLRLTVDGAVPFLHHKHGDNFTCRFLRRMSWWNDQAHALHQ